MLRNAKLWVQLAVVTLVLVVPLGLLPVWLLVSERATALASSKDGLRRLALLAAEQEDDAVQEASNLVRVLARVPDVVAVASDTCHNTLRELVNEHPRIGSIMVSEPDGAVSCDSISPVARGITVAGRDWFKETTARDAPVVVESELLTSGTSGELTMVVATALRRAGTPRPGALAAELNLDWFSTVADRFGGEDGAVVTLVSPATGTVFAGPGANRATAGDGLSDPALFEALRRDRSGVFEEPTWDGAGQIYGFARLPGTASTQTYVLVSRSRSSVVGPADRKLIASLGLLATVIATGAGGSVVLARRLVMRPLGDLVVTAQALGGGELHERVDLQRMQGPEFRSLAAALNEAADQLQARERELAALAMRDGLTGIANRRRFDAELTRACEGPAEWLGLAMIDVDHFKAFNDRHGHPEGDMVLRRVAHALATTMRKASDLVARYGGEEFVIMMPGLDEDGARAVGERVLDAVRALGLAHMASPSGLLTASVGLAVATEGQERSLADLVQTADEALYAAKRGGRDRAAIQLLADAGSQALSRPATESQSAETS